MQMDRLLALQRTRLFRRAAPGFLDSVADIRRPLRDTPSASFFSTTIEQLCGVAACFGCQCVQVAPKCSGRLRVAGLLEGQGGITFYYRRTVGAGEKDCPAGRLVLSSLVRFAHSGASHRLFPPGTTRRPCHFLVVGVLCLRWPRESRLPGALPVLDGAAAS